MDLDFAASVVNLLAALLVLAPPVIGLFKNLRDGKFYIFGSGAANG
jgi:hypothetical protein